MPLTNEESKLNQRIAEFTPRFNTNYAIAMSWAGAALSPNMRGSDGWAIRRYRWISIWTAMVMGKR
nr:hypothetical protein PJ912_17790 [Pectobacterium colocasium]